MDKPTVYVETTIPSYLVAEPSRDVVVAGHQRTTHDWWKTASDWFDLKISDFVYAEIARGDSGLAARRLDLMRDIPILASSNDVEELANMYVRELGLAGRALDDVPHVAFAVAYEVEYLVTWNCAHLANAIVVRKLCEINTRLGIWMPIICTPDELMSDPQERIP